MRPRDENHYCTLYSKCIISVLILQTEGKEVKIIK